MMEQRRHGVDTGQHDDAPGHGVVQAAEKAPLLVVDADQRGDVEQAEERERLALRPAEQKPSTICAASSRYSSPCMPAPASRSQPPEAGGRCRPRLSRQTTRSTNTAANSSPKEICTDCSRRRVGVPRGRKPQISARANRPTTRITVSQWKAIVARS